MRTAVARTFPLQPPAQERLGILTKQLRNILFVVGLIPSRFLSGCKIDEVSGSIH